MVKNSRRNRPPPWGRGGCSGAVRSGRRRLFQAGNGVGDRSAHAVEVRLDGVLGLSQCRGDAGSAAAAGASGGRSAAGGESGRSRSPASQRSSARRASTMLVRRPAPGPPRLGAVGVERDSMRRPGLAEAAVHGVAGDAEDPHQQGRLALEALQHVEDGEEDLLGHVLGLRGVAQAFEGEAVDAGEVALVEQLEVLALPCQDLSDQLTVVGPRCSFAAALRSPERSPEESTRDGSERRWIPPGGAARIQVATDSDAAAAAERNWGGESSQGKAFSGAFPGTPWSSPRKRGLGSSRVGLTPCGVTSASVVPSCAIGRRDFSTYCFH